MYRNLYTLVMFCSLLNVFASASVASADSYQIISYCTKPEEIIGKRIPSLDPDDPDSCLLPLSNESLCEGDAELIRLDTEFTAKRCVVTYSCCRYEILNRE